MGGMLTEQKMTMKAIALKNKDLLGNVVAYSSISEIAKE
jgi:hypothetical protein